jgi:hypothetical protein
MKIQELLKLLTTPGIKDVVFYLADSSIEVNLKDSYAYVEDNVLIIEMSSDSDDEDDLGTQNWETP